MPNGFLPTQEETPIPQAETPAPPEAEPKMEAPIGVEEVSSVEADEQAREQAVETEETFLETPAEEAPTTEIQIQTAAEGVPATATPAPTAVVKDEVMIQVEKILEEELGAYFETMPEEAKIRFKKKGEEVAGQISVMVRTFRVKVKAVLHLVRDWLLTIPGVNKFFLEQEAKIKTDKILEYSSELREESKNKI